MKKGFLITTLLLFIFSVNSAQMIPEITQKDSTRIESAKTDSTSGSILSTETIGKELAQEQPEWSVGFAKIFWSLVVFIIGMIVIKYSSLLIESISEKWIRFRLTIKGFIPIFRILSWTLVGYIIIGDILAPPIATVVAITASAGIAVGFASQDILKNIFGGIMILFDRPFQVGDKIEIGNYYGEVVSIGLRTVRIVTPDDSLVAIPNSEIVNQSVSNSNAGESNCQVVSEFYLPAHININEAKKLAYRAAAVSRYVYLEKPIVVIIKNEIHQGRSLLKMRLKAYVSDIRFEFAFASEMTETVIKEFLHHNIVTARELSLLDKEQVL
ncbi:MAG: mechanosensitive ion channel family protein [Melioribacteraceae bacterium]|nr:mechanosensitive ion channel family protein [Melioribacteraceae bacterium]MCF8263910.1 mechanosensitive ion channel family protein [Melioribacteraceae bacterium]MCF8430315.1 mechanosensitive ion channel family protein [Melioribacteraceae bacterium]